MLAKHAAAEGGAHPAMPTVTPKPTAEQTPLDDANRQAAEAFVAFVQGRYDEALATGTRAVEALEGCRGPRRRRRCAAARGRTQVARRKGC